MNVQGKIEIWLHIHGYKLGMFEVSASGADTGRFEIPVGLVDRFHTDLARPGKGLFRVPEYLLIGLGVYKPRESVMQTEMPKNTTGAGTTRKPILTDKILEEKLAAGAFDDHHDEKSSGVLESDSVLRSPMASAIRSAKDLSDARFAV